MKKEIFIEELKNIGYTDEQIVECKVNKNNETLEGVSLKVGMISPTFYPETIPDDTNVGDYIKKVMSSSPTEDELPDFTTAEGKTFAVKVVAIRNEEYLKNKVFRQYLDMAVVPFFVVSTNEEGIGSVAITEDLLKSWGITEEELWEKIVPEKPVFKDMLSVLMGFSEELAIDPEDLKDADCPMFVLTNESKLNGAALITSGDVQKFIFTSLGEKNYYVLPSSVHEVIIVPESEDVNPSALLDMVIEVNSTQVMPQDKLTDSVYYYDGNELKIIATEGGVSFS